MAPQTKAQRSAAAKKAAATRKANAKRTRNSTATKPRATKKPSSTRKRAKPQSAGKAVREPVANTGSGAGKVASKARVPLLAGGAAIAGTIGGVVIGATRSGGKVLGIRLPRPRRVTIRSKDLASAAREVGRFGENVGDLAAEVKRTREGLGSGNGKHSSPIEILLRGLTERR